jgi:hypothetical protein
VRYCPRCGTETVLEAGFCHSCGTRLGESDKSRALATQDVAHPAAGVTAPIRPFCRRSSPCPAPRGKIPSLTATTPLRLGTELKRPRGKSGCGWSGEIGRPGE